MAVANFKLFILATNGRTVKDSKSMEAIFKSLSVSADGNDNGLTITESSGKFDFNGKKLSNVAAGTASGQVLVFDQLGANNGVASLDGGGKIPASQLPSSVMEYKGTWNASTNTPTLANGTGDAGDVYIVDTAGSTDFGAGSITFAVGDWVIYNGTIWEKSLNSDTVVSVNGQTGVVVLDSDDISEGATNKYFTQGAFDTAFAGKSTDDLGEGSTNKYFSDALAKAAVVDDAIVDSVTDRAPSQNVVFDALALKADKSDAYRSLQNDEGGSTAHTVRQLVFLSAFGKVKLALATNTALKESTVFAMVKDASIADQASGNYWLPKKGTVIGGFSSLVYDQPLFLSRTSAGGFQTSAPATSGDAVVRIGYAISATEIVFDPWFEYQVA